MVEPWIDALSGYRYPVNLNEFSEADRYPDWFNLSLLKGDREETQRFEDHFRQKAPDNLEVWYEVIYWKLSSQGGRADYHAGRVIERMEQTDTSAEDLWNACQSYVAEPTRMSLDRLRKLLFTSPAHGVPVTATFPAFSDPQRLPMVDTRIAKWVDVTLEEMNAADPSGPQLVRSRYTQTQATSLTMADWPFVNAWTEWARHTAMKLSARTDMQWRARDVDMAVFHAWGGRGCIQHPALHLPALPPETGS